MLVACETSVIILIVGSLLKLIFVTGDLWNI